MVAVIMVTFSPAAFAASDEPSSGTPIETATVEPEPEIRVIHESTKEVKDQFSKDKAFSTQAINTNAVNQSTWYTLVEYKSLVGLTVATQKAYTQWTWGDGYLYSFGRALWQDLWSVPPNFWSDASQSWDYFYTGYGGFGQSHHVAKLTFGVPTPWGPIGSNIWSNVVAQVDGYGNYRLISAGAR
ncbi:MAG: hypothetical protein H0Z35_06750 [Thermoanaerobacteraceae bacterium]|nr:hypothetical protein [Thermoanaerobacteraceae bacterium]